MSIQKGRRLGAALLLLLVPVLSLRAQAPEATLVGRVTNAETGEPLPGAAVFIATSTKGTTADADGHFRLDRVPVGAHRLYVSMLGFEPVSKDVVLRRAGEQTFDFALKPSVIEGEEVVVTGEHDRKWRQRLEKFTGLFIGETPNAGQTKLVNPEVLDFTERVGRFTARASEPLVIENEALGYRVRYFLKEFSYEGGRTMYDGEPLYEELTPADPGQAAVWEANRRKAYMGSFRHFILSVFDGTWEEQGFLIYHRPASGPSAPQGVFAGAGRRGATPRFPIEPKDFVKAGESPLERTLDFHGFVEIVYTRETEDPSFQSWGGRRGATGADRFQTSQIQLERGPAVVDYKGDPHDPYGITFYGYLAFERVADELPKEYRPGR